MKILYSVFFKKLWRHFVAVNSFFPVFPVCRVSCPCILLEISICYNFFYKMKCKGPIFLTDFKRVYFFTIKGETAVCRNESCLYEVQALQAIINIPLVHVSASALGRSHLAVVENLICACWSIPGAPLWKPSSNSYQRWKSSNRGLRNEGLVRAAPEDNKYTSIFERLQNIMSLINPSLPEEWKENKSGDTRGREKRPLLERQNESGGLQEV